MVESLRLVGTPLYDGLQIGVFFPREAEIVVFAWNVRSKLSRDNNAGALGPIYTIRLSYGIVRSKACNVV